MFFRVRKITKTRYKKMQRQAPTTQELSALDENVLAIGALKDILASSLGPNARSKLIVDPKKRYGL